MTVDLGDPSVLLRADVLDDPGAFHDALRREAPVWQIPGQDSYVVSEPKLIREAVGRPEDFSNNLVSLLHDDGTGCPVAFAMAPYRDPIHVLSTADPPLHTRHRKLLQAHLTPAEVAALEPAVAAIVDEYLAVMRGSGHVDCVTEFSEPVPARTICALIGLPLDDTTRIIEIVAGTGALLDGVTDADGMREAGNWAIELGVYVHTRLQEALARPAAERVGLFAVFGDAIESDVVTADEVRDMMLTLVSAGSDTTASLIATAVEGLARDPDLQARLRRDPDRIPDALERFLRESGPFQFHYRYTPHDTTLGGVDIPAHSRVMLMWAAANRPAPDEPDSVGGPEPDAVDARGPAPHYAFGRGLHFCIGAPVARMEARVALERLLAATRSFALDPEHPPVRRPSIFIRRHRSLPLVVEWT